MSKNKTNERKSGGKKISGFFRDSAVKPVDWVLLALIACFCFLSYEMRDLYHTAGCSYGFLDGHFWDFYDYLASSGIAEDGSIGLHASYMPTVYLIFAVWNIPMKLFGFVPHASAVLGFVPIMWAKMLPCLAWMGCGSVVMLIGRELGMKNRKSKLLMYAFLTMPVGIFGQFILGQYESFLVLFVLLGTLCWLRGKNVQFVLFFAIAMTFKYTAVLVFLPLLMLREKKIWKILAMTAGVFVLFALEYLFYHHSATFLSYAFGIGSSGDNPTGYVTNASYFTGFSLGTGHDFMVYLAFLAFALVAAYAYFTKPLDRESEVKHAMYFCCLALASLFCFSKWHPHWLMLCVPFWTITAFMHRDTKVFMALDLMFSVLLVMFCTGYFVGVTDEVMLQCGIFKYLLPGGKVTSETTMSEMLCKLDSSILLSLLTAIMAVFAVFKHPKFMSGDTNVSADGSIGWIRARLIIGSLVFIVPSMVCLLTSAFSADTCYLEENRAIFVSAEELDGLSQEFNAGSELKKLKFPVSVGDEPGSGLLKVTVSDADGVEAWTDELSISDFYEGELVTLKPGVDLTQGADYTVTFELETPETAGTFSLLAAPSDDSHENAESGGEEKAYHLDMNIYG